jgi:hypothetical protein
MRISYTPEQEELRRELRAYFDTLMTPERREALMSTAGEYGSGNVYRETVAQMGRDGWLALGWPKEYGGQARSTMDQLIFTDEAAVAGHFATIDDERVDDVPASARDPTPQRAGENLDDIRVLPHLHRGGRRHGRAGRYAQRTD